MTFDESTPLLQASTAQRVSILVPCVLFLFFSWSTVILRLYTRGVLVRVYGWDDYSMVFTLLSFTLFNVGLIMCAYSASKDYPTPSGHILIPEAKTAIIWLQVSLGLYVATMIALKISVAVLYLRIMVEVWQRTLVLITLATIIVFSSVYFFFAIFQCGPISDPMLFLQKKLDDECRTHAQILGASYAHGALNSVSDLVFAFMPVVMLKRSNMHFAEKFSVMFILTLASIGGIASMVRMKYIDRLATATTSWFQDANLIGIWSTIEPGLGIIAASLATLRPLLKRVLPLSGRFGSGSWRPGTLNRMQVLQATHFEVRSERQGSVNKSEEMHMKELQHEYQCEMWDARRGNWEDDEDRLESINTRSTLYGRC